MKRILLIAVYLMLYSISFAQEQENTIAALERQAEALAEEKEPENEDDSFLQQLAHFKKHPLNLNEAEAADLKELFWLSDLQIESLLSYRRLLGNFVDLYEIQAVPAWNTSTIQKLLPYITVTKNKSVVDNIKERWTAGEHNIILRTSLVLEKSAGYQKQTNSDSFTGNGNRLMMRYSYNYKGLLKWGILGDKDAGEQFFKGSQKSGFDFYSFHLYLSKFGLISSLVLGDFTVNIGQGLIQWQSMAFKKSAEITSIKRQATVLRPYTAPGEFNFHRGAGITLQKGIWEGTVFLSLRKLTGNFEKDSVMDQGHISSISSSGYHRTAKELEDRNNLRQITTGGSIRCSFNNLHLAANALFYNFSLPLQKQDRPYNLFAPRGKSFANESIDYSYTLRNFHVFGELAVDKDLNKAFLNGLLVSLSPAADLTLVYRSMSRSYQSFYTNAFTENSMPVNEQGFYAGLSIRPSDQVKINLYADRYYFPWLKYRVDAPSSGREYYVQLVYKPNKAMELYGVFRKESKEQNITAEGLTVGAPGTISRQSLRVHYNVSLNRSLVMRSRVETIFYNRRQATAEEGFLMLCDLLYKPALKPWSGNIRLLYFETSGYNSRLYAFENDVLYNFSIPAMFDRGYRYYLNGNINISKWAHRFMSKKTNIECWVRTAQTLYPGKKIVGSGPDEINGDRKTEIKFQLMISF